MEELEIEELKKQIGIESIYEAIPIISEAIKSISSNKEDKLSEIEIAWEIICDKLNQLEYYETYERYAEAFNRIQQYIRAERGISPGGLSKEELKKWEAEEEILSLIDIKELIF